MSSFAILDSYATLRRELSLILATQLKSEEFGPKQMTILYRLAQEPTSMSDLAAFCQSDPAATTRMVASLERAGLVKRIEDSTDNRRSIISLTKKGKIKAVKATVARRDINSMVTKTLEPAEQVMLVQLLNKVVDGLRTTKQKRK